MRITAEGFVHYEVRASVRPRDRRSGVERRSVQGLVSKQQAAARPKRASTTMLDTCMERIETCDSATWSSLPVPKSEAKEERVLLLVYLLVEVHVVDPSINWVLLGSEGAQI
jgi:hypothetical protein